MKKLISIFAILVLAGWFAWSYYHKNYGTLSKYTFSKGGFQIRFPEHWEEEESMVKTGFEENVKAYMIYGNRGDSSFFVTSFSLFKGAPKQIKKPNELLEKLQKNVLTQVSGKKITSKSISYEGEQGVEFSAQTDKGALKARIYLFEGNVYLLLAYSKIANKDKGVEQFLNSFSVL